MKQSVTEEFWYDSLNRFDYSKRNGVTNQDVTLNAIGNLTWKLGIGNYSYHTTRKRAVIAAGSNSYGYDANGNMMSRNGSSITYTSYNLPSLINAGSNSSAISYGAFRNRYKQVAVTSGVTETTIYLAGLLERVTKGSITEYRHKIHGGNGVAAIYTRRSSGSPLISTYYVHTDHLGSPELITDSAGAQVVKLSFGAYGERRDSDWEGPVSAADQTTIGNTWRGGFTGHEHLDAVGLIHMNGRVYDPVVARFLSRDPFIDGVDRSQGPNGYAYVHNNPLNRIDPSGYCASAADCPQGPGGPGGGFGELPLGPNTDVDFVFRIWNALASGAYGPELAQYGQDLIACFATSCPGVDPPSLDPGDDNPQDPDTTPSSSATMVQPLAVFTGSLMDRSAGSTVPRTFAVSAGDITLAVLGVAAIATPVPGDEILLLGGGGARALGALGGAFGVAAIAQTASDRAASYISGIVERATRGRDQYQYALVALTAGPRPNVRGGVTYLNVGDVYKYGTSVNPDKRYSQAELTALDVVPIRQHYGTATYVLIQEKLRLLGYFSEHGTLPPGNRIWR